MRGLRLLQPLPQPQKVVVPASHLQLCPLVLPPRRLRTETSQIMKKIENFHVVYARKLHKLRTTSKITALSTHRNFTNYTQPKKIAVSSTHKNFTNYAQLRKLLHCLLTETLQTTYTRPKKITVSSTHRNFTNYSKFENECVVYAQKLYKLLVLDTDCTQNMQSVCILNTKYAVCKRQVAFLQNVY